MEEILKLLSAGGDIGIYVLIFIVWKFDKRLVIVETHLTHLINGGKKKDE